MKKILQLFMVLLIIPLMSMIKVNAQELQVSLFDEVKSNMKLAKSAQADILSPGIFENAMEEYLDASRLYNKDGDLTEIRKSIGKANTMFLEALANTEVSSVMFSSTLSARNDAINGEAPKFVTEKWNMAEEKFKDAASELERGDADDAKEKAFKATALYRDAELESIKAIYLTNAKNLLEKADQNKVDKVAPKTIAEAIDLVNRAEVALLENRYDTDEARFLAKKAEYKALLAIHIAEQEAKLDELDFKTEDYLLMSYAQLEVIGESLGLRLRFDEGQDSVLSSIVARIKNDHLQLNRQSSDLYIKQVENINLQDIITEQQVMINSMSSQLSTEELEGRERQVTLQNRIDGMAEITRKFEEVQRLFDNEEADVFRQKDDVIIRMIGINFEIGKAQIKDGDYALLTKLRKAISLFDNSTIVIEGHTDSQGGDDLNLKLSQDRADAVLNYLSANTDIESARFSTAGFGESKPVANNETRAGRKMNRRIDIVIRPMLNDVVLGSNIQGQ